jgi:hypothetical protein
MAATDYRVTFVEFSTGVIWGELPVQTASFSRVLNAPGAASFKVPLSGEAVRDLPWSSLTPWRVLMYVQRGQQILWGGPLVGYGVDLAAEEVTFNCQGLWAYYRRRLITKDATFAQQDQALIVRTLLKDFADGTGQYAWNTGPKALTFAETYTTGVKRDRTYRAYELKSVGAAVEDMAGVRDGFNFRIDYGWSGGRIVNTFTMMYPTTGDPTSLVLHHGGNCDVPSVTVDGANMVTESAASGAGSAETQLRAWWYDLAHETDPGRQIPRLSAVQSRSDVIDVATLTGYAQQAVSEGSVPVTIPTVRLHPGRFPGAGDVFLGQIVTIRADVADWPGMAADYKIMEIATTVSDSGEETTLSLAPVEVFANVGSAAQP